jgi:hypothetical protein
MSSRDTCPTACPLKGHGCYGEYGPLAWTWNKLDDGRRGGEWEDMLPKIAALPDKQVWRLNVVGDLPHQNGEIDQDRLDRLIEANRGKRGFSYTHHLMTEVNQEAIRKANKAGLVVNLSANTLAEADRLAALGIGPVVVSMPKDGADRVTPEGRKVVVCPAYTKNTNCSVCQLCPRKNRRSIVGFPAHGSGAKYVGEVFNA